MNSKSKALNLLEEIASGSRDDRIACTLSLNKANYLKLKNVSVDSKVKISHILDSLIENFVADIEAANPSEVKYVLKSVRATIDAKKK